MIQFDEYKVKLNNLAPALEELGNALGLDAARQEVEMLHSQSASEGFWDNMEKALKIQQRVKQLEDKIAAQTKRESAWKDLMALCEMGNEFEDDVSRLPELEEGFARFGKGHGEGPAGHPVYRRIRQLQRHPHLPCRRWRHRGAGLGSDALPDVHPLGGTARLHLSDHGLSGRRRSGHQIRHHPHRG